MLQGAELGVATDVPRMAGGDAGVDLAVPCLQVVRNAVGPGFQNLIHHGRLPRRGHVAINLRRNPVEPDLSIDRIEQPRIRAGTRRGC